MVRGTSWLLLLLGVVAFCAQASLLPHGAQRHRRALAAVSTAREATRRASRQAATFTSWYDKYFAGRGIWKWNNALEAYQRHFGPLAGQRLKLVEVGVQSGGAIAMWRSVLGARCHVYGIDASPAAAQFNDPMATIVIQDQEAAALRSVAPEPPKPSCPPQLDQELCGVLTQHNLYRCMHNAPPLVWDDAIAANAQAWANEGVLEPSLDDERVVHGEHLGENLAWGASAPTAGWYKEIEQLQNWAGAAGTSNGSVIESCVNDSMCFSNVEHFAQVVWNSSGKIGCGKGKALNAEGNDGALWVCQYGPAGDLPSSAATNVLAVAKTAAECGGATHLVAPPQQASAALWTSFFNHTIRAPVDIVVESGGHQAEAMLATLVQTFDHLTPGGMVAFEDLNNHIDLDYFMGGTVDFVSQQAAMNKVASLHMYPFLMVVQRAGDEQRAPVAFNGTSTTVAKYEDLWAEVPKHAGGHVVLRNTELGSLLSERNLGSILHMFRDLHDGTHWQEHPAGCVQAASTVCSMTMEASSMQAAVRGVHVYDDRLVVEVHDDHVLLQAVRRGTSWTGPLEKFPEG